MRNFTKINRDNILINALYLQPTNLCAYNCKDCYVKAWGEKQHFTSQLRHLDPTAWYMFMFKMAGLDTANYHTNQMTFALDALPREAGTRRYMRELFMQYLSIAQSSKDCQLDTEFHITVQTLSNIHEYCLELSDLTVLDMISITGLGKFDISHLALLKQTIPDTHINWNLHPMIFSDEKGIENSAKLVSELSEHVDSIYFIMHKPDLGKKLNPAIVKSYFQYYKAIRTEFEKTGQDPNKIQLDGCVKDSKHFADGLTGGCSSNISRFQVWPDGSVSGCPYAHTPITKSAGCNSEDASTTIVDNILNNIRAAARIYQFNNCKIPDSLYPDSNGVYKRNNKSLIIIED